MASALHRAGMTQSSLARLAKMSPQALAHWCAGKVEPQPNILAWVERLANAIEKHPPPAWRSGRWNRARGGKNQNGQGATGRERPSHSVTHQTAQKHDLPPVEARRPTGPALQVPVT
jgi:transcriptional regulator with XRE-family HTH domain